jgi:hypothetical protein
LEFLLFKLGFHYILNLATLLPHILSKLPLSLFGLARMQPFLLIKWIPIEITYLAGTLAIRLRGRLPELEFYSASIKLDKTALEQM